LNQVELTLQCELVLLLSLYHIISGIGKRQMPIRCGIVNVVTVVNAV
jgi:hypothetical protein